ncbi:hypothetical protein K431DRAFT_164930 [Polychaeton citri CBS 116435]|uniref:Cora-domain-containing protein n=1 Tax=Polychaeton citri CBS 116435 TaxID=1314669 RepID=A0A9P4UQ28_9PEZI|nr:hypothetical protein K431DRAFT_164930 [Polychaeton citri CBS 116435]
MNLGRKPTYLKQSGILDPPKVCRTRARYIGSSGRYDSADVNAFVNFTTAQLHNNVESAAVCIIENVHPNWMHRLQDAFGIPQDFFREHARNPPDESLWETVFTRSKDPRWVPPLGPSQSWHSIDAIYEYHGWKTTGHGAPAFEGKATNIESNDNFFKRHCWEGPSPYPISSNTKISYVRVMHKLAIFLVDAPLGGTRNMFARVNRKRTTLRLPYSCNRGGLLLPQLFAEPEYSLFESLSSCFQHFWHFNILFAPYLDPGAVLGGGELLYLLSASLWDTNRRYLESEIRRISFEDIRTPSVETNSALHDFREDLVHLKDGVVEAQRYVPQYVKDYYKRDYDNDQHRQFLNQESPVDRHTSILKDAIDLSHFLMETFELLNSTIGVLDSQTSLEQARRGSRLTQLAFIYVPLSFVTGIYGMNVKEVNDSPLSVWVCFVTLAVVIIATAVVFLSYESFARHRKANARQEHTSTASGPTNIQMPRNRRTAAAKLTVKAVKS